MMKLTSLALAATVSFVAMTATAQEKTAPLTIAAGMQGGGYAAYAESLRQRLGQRGYSDITVTNNNGSDAITLAACNGNADIWIAQIDAIYTRFQEGCVLTPVADYGLEYAFLLVPPKSDIDELGDLDETSRIAVDGIGSGTELFWKTIVSIEKGDDGSDDAWANARQIESAPSMLNTMANFGDVQAAVLVRKKESNDIALLLNQGWSIAELWDKDIDDQVFNNRPLYTSNEVLVQVPGKKYSNWVYEVRAFVGVTQDLAKSRAFVTDVASSTPQ